MKPIACIVLLAFIAAAPATTQTSISPADNSFTIAFPSTYHPNEKLHRANPNTLLAYAQDRVRVDGIAPIFFIMAIPQPDKVDLDATAKATLDQATQNLPQKDSAITKA